MLSFAFRNFKCFQIKQKKGETYNSIAEIICVNVKS